MILFLTGQLDDYFNRSPQRPIGEELVKIQKEKEITAIQISIRNSLKKGFYFNFEDICEESRKNLWLSLEVAAEYSKEALERLGFKPEDFKHRY